MSRPNPDECKLVGCTTNNNKKMRCRDACQSCSRDSDQPDFALQCNDCCQPLMDAETLTHLIETYHRPRHPLNFAKVGRSIAAVVLDKSNPIHDSIAQDYKTGYKAYTNQPVAWCLQTEWEPVCRMLINEYAPHFTDKVECVMASPLVSDRRKLSKILVTESEFVSMLQSCSDVLKRNPEFPHGVPVLLLQHLILYSGFIIMPSKPLCHRDIDGTGTSLFNKCKPLVHDATSGCAMMVFFTTYYQALVVNCSTSVRTDAKIGHISQSNMWTSLFAMYGFDMREMIPDKNMVSACEHDQLHAIFYMCRALLEPFGRVTSIVSEYM